MTLNKTMIIFIVFSILSIGIAIFIGSQKENWVVVTYKLDGTVAECWVLKDVRLKQRNEEVTWETAEGTQVRIKNANTAHIKENNWSSGFSALKVSKEQCLKVPE